MSGHRDPRERGRSPDYRLRLKTADGKSASVGAAWRNDHLGDNAHINVQINPGVVLDWKSLEGCVLTLFPIDKGDPA